jgi:putative ABC transport system ATP-binding protein
MLTVHQLRKTLSHTDSPSFTLAIDAFHVERGQEIALMGESGSGKTTLFHLLAGIILPDSGHITLDSTEITTLSEAQRDRFRAKHIGCVYQTFNLLQGFTALENVLLAQTFAGHTGASHRTYAKDLLARLGIGEKMHRYPKALSVGEQQRVAVARALANKPLLLIADEPTASVDARNAERIIAELRSLAHESRASLIIITHDRTVAEMLPMMLPFSSLIH